MSLTGKTEGSYKVRGKVTALDYLLITAYGIALKNGFVGTEKQWLDSLDGTKVTDEQLIRNIAAYFRANPVEDGLPGHDGTTFTPSVDDDGNLSWTNNGGLENPETVNITGPQGEKGKDGEDGEDGYSPVKGEDYWTEEDQSEIKAELQLYMNTHVVGAGVIAVTGDITLAEIHAGKFLRVDGAATITVPANVFQIGVEIEVFRNSSEEVTIASGGPTFAVVCNTELVTASQSIVDQYGSVILKQIATNVWSVQGAI